jgi:hypothetical protein
VVAHLGLGSRAVQSTLLKPILEACALRPWPASNTQGRMSVIISLAMLLATITQKAQGVEHAASGPQECVTDSAAQSTLRFARSLMTSPDSFWTDKRSEYRLPRLDARDVSIVTAKSVCERAADAYANRFGPQARAEKPERIALVQAGGYYFVEDPYLGEGSDEPNAEFWEIQLFTRHWHPIVSFGGGS